MADIDASPRATTSDPVQGVAVDRVSAWLESHVDGATAPFMFDPDHRRALEPHDDRHRQRRSALRSAAPATRSRAGERPRHGARTSHHRRAAVVERPGATGCRTLHRRVGERHAVLRDGVRRRPRPPRRRSVHRRTRRDGTRQRESIARRHDGEDPRRRSRRRGPVRTRTPRGLHRAPAETLVQPVEPRQRPATSLRSTASTTG